MLCCRCFKRQMSSHFGVYVERLRQLLYDIPIPDYMFAVCLFVHLSVCPFETGSNYDNETLYVNKWQCA